MSSVLAGARWWLPLYLALAVAAGFVDLRVRAHPEHAVQEYIPQVVEGSAHPPGRYRVLAPLALTAVERALGLDPMSFFLLARWLLLLGSMVALHVYLREWFTPAASSLGVLLLVGFLPLTYTNSWPHPDHLPELLLFILAARAVATGRDDQFLLWLVLASFNRETSAFLIPLYLLGAPLTRRRLFKTIGFGLAWAAIFVGLRAALGFASYDYWQLWRNVEFLRLLPPPRDPYYRAYAWFVVVFTVPLAWVAWQSRTRQPWFLRHSVWVVPMLLAVGFTVSSIIETRIFTPILVLLIPPALFTLVQGSGLASSTERFSGRL